jgi:ribonuclease III
MSCHEEAGIRDRNVKSKNKQIPDEKWIGLEKELGYSFQKNELLKEAVTHKSYLNEVRDSAGKDNERLEFLGDAVLDLAISEHLTLNFPSSSEGELSKMKSRIVSERALARVARHLNLGEYLLFGKGEVLTKGREKPSLLADALEAIIAAIYIDGGEMAAKVFILSAFAEEIRTLEHSVETSDYKTELQEYCQRKFETLPVYRVLRETGPDHQKVFEVELAVRRKRVGVGQGRSKKEAEQQAARQAIEKFKIIT